MDMFKDNKHAHPLVYMRGITANNLTSIVDFIYYGEVNIFQEDLKDFLSVAEDLALMGLMGEEGRLIPDHPDLDESSKNTREQTLMWENEVQHVSEIAKTKSDHIEDKYIEEVNDCQLEQN